MKGITGHGRHLSFLTKANRLSNINMENFEETVVNPNIQLKGIGGQVEKILLKQEAASAPAEKKVAKKKSFNGFYLLAAAACIGLLVAILIQS